jgi:hypothetical protein
MSVLTNVGRLRTLKLPPIGQIPAYEWNFSDVNPPVHAWATIFLHRTEEALRGDVRVARSGSLLQRQPAGGERQGGLFQPQITQRLPPRLRDPAARRAQVRQRQPALNPPAPCWRHGRN